MKSSIRLIIAMIVIIPGCFIIANGSQSEELSALDINLNSVIDANQILMLYSNLGMMAHTWDSLFPPGIGGLYYPYTNLDDIDNGLTHSLVYSSGIWLGGKVSDETRVALAEFSPEFWPGPMTEGTFDPEADTIAAYRVYKLYSDSLASNPNQDYLDWPSDQGAPINAAGKPVCLGDQTLWAVYNDANPDGNPSRDRFSAPLGIEVRQTIWASDQIGEENAVYMEYRLFNKGGNSIEDFHLSIWLDPDLGDFTDDLVGCDRADDIYYCYNATNDDTHYPGNPPAVGYKLLAGPVVPSPGDSALFFREYIQDYKNVRMSSFYKYIGGIDPQSADWAYNYMRGMEQDGSLPPNGSVFQVTGDPVTASGELDSIPGNRMMLGSFGPIDFNPGDSQYVLVKLAVGRDTDHLKSITRLRSILNTPFNYPVEVGEEVRNLLPDKTILKQNYPNPFNSSTVISYSLSRRSSVSIEIFNALGQKVANLNQGLQPVGDYDVIWNGLDNRGASLPSGVYLYRIKSADENSARKMIFLK